MTIALMPLPYSSDALAPHISRETLEFHHGKHHRGYVDKVNKAIEGTGLAGRDLESIVKAAREQGDDKLFNSAAQAWNHGFYWHSLSPERSEPSGALADAISRDFGSLGKLNEQLAAEAKGHFASGWAWLVADGDKLEVVSTHDAGTALLGKARPLLTIDVWEHAYYIDFRNDRAAYLEAVIENRLDWDFASRNYKRTEAWAYPSHKYAHEER